MRNEASWVLSIGNQWLRDCDTYTAPLEATAVIEVWEVVIAELKKVSED